jgi:hypothetical protein
LSRSALIFEFTMSLRREKMPMARFLKLIYAILIA